MIDSSTPSARPSTVRRTPCWSSTTTRPPATPPRASCARPASGPCEAGSGGEALALSRRTASPPSCSTCTCPTSTASRCAGCCAQRRPPLALPVVHLSADVHPQRGPGGRPGRRRRRLPGAPGRAGGAGGHAAGADPRAHRRRPAAAQRAALSRHLRPGAQRHRAARRAAAAWSTRTRRWWPCSAARARPWWAAAWPTSRPPTCGTSS